MAVTLHLSITGYATAGSTTPASIVIEVQSASFEGEQTLNIGSQSSGAGAGKVTFNPFSITRKPDANSATFWADMCSGTAFKSIAFTATEAGASAPFLTFTMGLAAIKTLSVNATETGGALETITFEYGQATYGAALQNPDGSLGKVVTAGWDVTKNAKV
jgi:type VI protein secretion system component Hcp